MKTLILAVTAATLATSAFAMGNKAELDTDGDGMLSFAELLVAFPALSEATYTAMDANSDGAIDADELAAAEEAGLIVSEG
ncbi:EF-hand domain-containing protein [Tropicimonas sp. S265A]|uniref:EF-hand domain-containing protein n=1 Tax=Tropicimonas sp. S265A TaxID=3415134 RepID=UPI003C79EDB3